MKAKKWTLEEVKYLKENYKELFSSEIGEKLGKNKACVKQKMKSLGLKRGSVLKNGHGKNWRDKDYSYSAVHAWIRNNYGPAKRCENPDCNNKNAKRFEWSNISGKYKRDRNDFIQLCCSCHSLKDEAKDYCKRGHPLFGDNVYRYGIGKRQCKACSKIRKDKPEYKTKRKEWALKPENIQKAREAQKKYWNKPGVKEKKREYLKEWRRKRKLLL